MLQNIVGFKELNILIKKILKLDEPVNVKTTIYKILHFSKLDATDSKQSIINSNNTGVLSTYKGFEIEIRGLSDPKNDYTGVSIVFNKKRTFGDYFLNTHKSLFKDIVAIILEEIPNFNVKKFDLVGKSPYSNLDDEFFYSSNCLNPLWEDNNKISPLVIYLSKDDKNLIVEFIFIPECYERKGNVTKLRGNWIEVLNYHTRRW